MLNTLLCKGELQSDQTYIIDNDKVNQMYYHNIVNKTTAEMLYINNLLYYGLLNEYGKNKNNRLFYRHNVCLLDFNDKKEPPLLFNYENSSDKNEEQFKLSVHNKYFNISLFFDKSKLVIYHKNNNTYVVYSTKNVLEEVYYILEDGIFCINYIENKASFFNNSTNIEYNLSIKNRISNCILLNWLPYNIELSCGDDNKTFIIDYDKFGITKSCKNNDKELCDYYDESDSNESSIISVHPLLFDSFDFTNNFEYSELWVIDKLIKNNNFLELERKIYKLPK